MAPTDAVLARLTRLHPKAIDLSLARVRRLLDRLGRPQHGLPPVIHVAGTNGKGSVIAFLSAMLTAAGSRVHAYTSPHLVDFAERIVVAGAPISNEAFSALLEECEEANDDAPITFFEITTAAALLAFARTPGEVVLLETGLGGRLDATNVISRPRLCAITPISLDHQSFLGATEQVIATEKAAILKPGVDAVIGRQTAPVQRVVDRAAAKVGARLHVRDRHWTSESTTNGFILHESERKLVLPAPRLAGPHQVDNAAMAAACALRLNEFSLSVEAIAEGIRSAVWPGRLQRIDDQWIIHRLPRPAEIWLDGGHNPAAGAALAAVLRDWRDLPLDLVVGMMNTKDPVGFLAPLAAHTRALWAIPIHCEENAFPAQILADSGSQLGMRATSCRDLSDALDRIAAQPGPPSRVLICGSLRLAGQVLADVRRACPA